MKFPRETIQLGDCLLAVPLDRWGNPRKTFPGPEVKGYRILSHEGDRWPAHRLSYSLNISDMPPHPPGGKRASAGLVLHTCDNKWCVNPDHLYLGDRSDNTKDVILRHPTWNSNRSKSPEVRAKISARTKEAMAKIASPWLGRKHSQESIERMRIAQKARHMQRKSRCSA